MFKRAPNRKTDKDAYTLRQTVKLVRGGRGYFDLLEQMIAAAKHSIHMQVYIFDEDETGKRIASALMAAATRGVSVWLLVDGYASKALSNELIDNLRQSGIQFRMFEPVLKSKNFYFGRRLHHKVVVTDGFHCLVTGVNISDRYSDIAEVKAWLDWALYVEGAVAEKLVQLCHQRFRSRVLVGSSTAKPVSMLLPDADTECAVRVRVNDWVNRRMEITKSYLEMFKNATSDIIIMSPYFLPGELIRRRIRQAVNRGVKIRVIQAGISDIAMSKYAERYLYHWLLRNQVEIYEYQKSVLHGKLATYDSRWITVGSYNVNNLSMFASIELNLDVDNAAVAKKAKRTLEEIMKTDCVRITEAVNDQRTQIWNRVLQKIAYNLFRLVLFLFTFYFKQKE